MAKVRITQIKSKIDRNIKQKATLEAMGFKKTNDSVEHEKTPQIEGMINKVKHLVIVEDIK
jgi:large subunit ribosomal protein L30